MWYGLMIKPHEISSSSRAENKREEKRISDIKIQPRHAMRKCEINPNDILEMWVLRCRSYCLGKKNNKNHFFYFFFMSHRRAVMLLLSDTETTHFVFKIAHRTTPDNCASVGAHYVHVHVIMFQCLALDVQLHPKGKKISQHCRKMLRLCTQTSLFFPFFHRPSLGVLEVTRNLNDIFLEVMFCK